MPTLAHAFRQSFVLAFIFLVVLTAPFIWPTAFAQSTAASVSGRVTDQSNAAVVGAEVEIRNTDTGFSQTTQTNAAGVYSFPVLQPGNYLMNVHKESFRTVSVTGITLNLQDNLSRNFALQVGSVSESITVTGDTININTTDGSVSTVVDQTYVKNMPLNGRSFQDLILLTPGVVTQTSQYAGYGLGATGEFSVNGQRTEENYYTVDGVSANVGATAGQTQAFGGGPSGTIPGATALGTTQALVSVDDLQEFRIQTSSYSAEYGRTPGGQFAFETKSGTNQWHGTAYDYLRNGFFDAQDWFSDYLNTPTLALRQNDFGGTLGAPVRIPGIYNGKDKSFFFVSYEGLRLAQPQPPSANVFVPDYCLRGLVTPGSPGACEYPDGSPYLDINDQQRIPAPPELQPVMSAFPLPTANPSSSQAQVGMAPYIASWSNPSSINSTSVRFDQVVKDKLRLFFRFSNTGSDSAIRDQFLNYGPSTKVVTSYITRTYTAGATSVLSNRVSNDFRLNYTSNETAANQFVSPLGGSSPIDLRQLSGIGSGGAVFVGLFLGFNNTGLYQSHDGGSVGQWNLVDTIELSLGRHQLKFGFDYRRLASSAVITSPYVNYSYCCDSGGGLSLVQANNASIYVVNEDSAFPLYKNFSAFVADQWRVSPRLSLSMGLRWEVNPPPGVTKGPMPDTLVGSSLDTMALAPRGTKLWNTAWFNFGPRLGAAYTIRNTQGWETVLRGGGGVAFDTAQQLGSQGFISPGFFSQNLVNGTFPMDASTLVLPIQTPPSCCPYAYYVYGFSPHLQLPYTLEWNASVEQALGKTQALTISYVGSRGSRLLENGYFNPPNNTNTNGLGFNLVQSSGSSYHGALQTQFNRRLSRGLTVLASYTWSHCTDYGSSNLAFGYQKGDCDFDLRHSFSAAFSYDGPSVGGNRVLSAVLSHWGVDNWITARTAFPITLYGNDLLYPNGQTYNAGLNLTGAPVYVYGADCAQQLSAELLPGHGCPGGKALNPLAFQEVATGFGDAPRNFARLFGAWQMNLGIRREFPIHERLKLQFRSEAFNIFNHPNFGYVNSGCYGDPATPGCASWSQFGLVSATLAGSSQTLSPLYALGGARSMQFALKLIF